jgi:hypothetical protein
LLEDYFGAPALRSIGTIGGQLPTLISPIASNPCRS